MKNGQVHLKKENGNSIYLHRIYVANLFLVDRRHSQSQCK